MKENDTTDMGIFVDKLGALRQLRRMPHLGAHEPRFGEHLRGSISMEGAAVSVFRTFKEGTQVTFETTKQKDIEEPDPFDPQLFKTHTSAVLTLMQPGEQALTQPQMHILQTLQDAAAEWVSKTENSVTSGIPYTTYSKNINELINRGYVDQTKGKNKFLRYIPEKERRV